MLKLFEDLSGYYLPSFFYIYTEDSIDFQNFESNTAEIKGTFIHEYCHYIQDVSTTYGYTNAIYVLQELIKKTSREDKALEDILKSNRRCYSLCNGDKDVDATIWYINSIKIQTDEDFEYVLIQSLTGLIPRSLLRFTKMPSEARSRLISRSLLRGSLL